MSKRKNPQTKYRISKFSFDQIWNIHFTEVDSNDLEKDYKTIIKAPSADCAKKSLVRKIKEDNPSHKVKAIQLFMMAKGSRINNLILTLEDWAHVHRSAFPNSANVLFKFYKPRPKGYTNRFNSAKGTKSSRFKKGYKPNIYIPPKKDQPYWIYDGKWKPWDKKERESLKEKFKLALHLNDNCRMKAAEHMGISRHHFYDMCNKKFVEVDWQNDFPVNTPNISERNIDHQKRIESIRATKAKQKHQYTLKMYKKVKPLIDQGFSKTKIAKTVGANKNVIQRCIDYDKQRKNS